MKQTASITVQSSRASLTAIVVAVAAVGAFTFAVHHVASATPSDYERPTPTRGVVEIDYGADGTIDERVVVPVEGMETSEISSEESTILF